MTQHDSQLVTQSRSGMGEVPFEASCMFYSRTDERGVIIEGNSIFRRISGFGWEELKGAPHKLVRHPDMPKGVFHLYWERLKAGKQVAAYVKNKSKDGRYYWVLAVAWPIPGGYLSVRIKPHTELFSTIKDLYADLRRAELEESVSAAAAPRRCSPACPSLATRITMPTCRRRSRSSSRIAPGAAG